MAFTFPDALWSATTTYALGEKVNAKNANGSGGNGGYNYISAQNGNINHSPGDTIPTWWTLESDWASGTTYAAGDKVTYQGLAYQSLVGSNLNHIPSSTKGVWWDQLIVKDTFSPPPTVNDQIHFIPTGLVSPPMLRAGFAPDILTDSGLPFQSHVGTMFYRTSLSNPPSSPGPSNVWIGRVVFRVIRAGWYVGLGQRANKTPISHNSGD